MNFRELLSDAMPIIEKFAPIVATKINLPLGSSLMLLGLVYTAFDAPSKDGNFDFAQLSKNIVNDPDVDSKLKQLEDLYK